MNKEEFKKITEYLDKMVILHQTTGETINKDLDISIRLSVAYEELEQENKKLNKQLEELKQTNKVLSEELTKDKILKQDCLTTCCGIPIGDIPKLINQQKEFIDYMEEKIICYENYQNTNLGEYERNLYFDIYNDILEKYKEIIGGKE